MANWCSTAYAIEGDAKEIKSLYELMKGGKNRPLKTGSGLNGSGVWWTLWVKTGTK